MDEPVLIEKLEGIIEEGQTAPEEISKALETLRGSFHIWQNGNGVYTAQTTGRFTNLFKGYFFSRDRCYREQVGIPNEKGEEQTYFHFQMREFVETFGHAQTFQSIVAAIRAKADSWHSSTEQFLRDLEEFGKNHYIASWIRLSPKGTFTLCSDQGHDRVKQDMPKGFTSYARATRKHPLPLALRQGNWRRTFETINRHLSLHDKSLIVANPYIHETEEFIFLKNQPFYQEEFDRIHSQNIYGVLFY